MSRLSEITQQIERDWPDEPIVLDLLRAVLTLRQADYVTIPLLVQLLNVARGEPLASYAGDAVRCAVVRFFCDYLTTEHVALLEPHFELTRDDGTTTPIEPSQYRLALEDGRFYDPDSGLPIRGWRHLVVHYYSATQALRDVLREHHEARS